MDSCIFCKITTGEIPSQKLFENDQFLAFLDIKPINLGHTLLITKAHHENLFGISPKELQGMMEPVQKIAEAVKKATNADGINIGMNNGAAAGQIISHAHIHIIPRFLGDGFKSWHRNDLPSKEELDSTAQKIKSLIEFY